MIALLNENNIELFNEYLKSSFTNIFYTRITALYKAFYGYDNLCSFYCQTNSTGKLTAVLSCCGRNCIVHMLDDCDFNEITDFAQAVAASLLSDKQIACNAQCHNTALWGYIMLLDSGENIEIEQKYSLGISPRDYYSLLEKCSSENFNVPCFEDYYVDINHKIRKNAAVIYGAYSKGELVSGACAFIGSGSIFINGVCTLPTVRQQGIGRGLIKQISKDFSQREYKVFLQCTGQNNKSFYEKSGFKCVGKWQEIVF